MLIYNKKVKKTWARLTKLSTKLYLLVNVAFLISPRRVRERALRLPNLLEFTTSNKLAYRPHFRAPVVVNYKLVEIQACK